MNYRSELLRGSASAQYYSIIYTYLHHKGALKYTTIGISLASIAHVAWPTFR